MNNLRRAHPIITRYRAKMENKTENEILEAMKKYPEDQFELYKAEAGWQDWMNEYTEANEEDPASEREIKEIEKIQKELWNESHNN